MMGAGNVKIAYTMYAGKLDHLPMRLLAYMAVISLDDDKAPWFGAGHAALAEIALGRKPNAAAMHAVKRGVAQLLDVGAVTIDRPPAVRQDGPSTTRYRLNLRATGSPEQVAPVQDMHSNGGGHRHRQGGHGGGERPHGGAHRPHGGGERPPDEYEEPGGLTTTEDNTSIGGPTRDGALRAREATTHDLTTTHGIDAERERQTAALAAWQREQERIERTAP